MYSQRRALRSATAAVASAATAEDTEDEGVSQQVPGTSGGGGGITDSEMNSQANRQADDDDDDDDNDDVEEEYGDMHRLVLQGVMAAGYLDAKGVKKLFQESSKFLKCKIPVAADIYPYIQKVVREINEKIKTYDMMIRSATCEITGEKFYVFLVTIEKPIMKMQQYFTKQELDLFQKILDSLLRKHRNFTISKIECVNIAGELDSRALTKVNAEDFVDRMITMKYFTKVYKNNDTKKNEKDRDYDITLGFRTIREFEPIFREVYGDIFGNCCLCKMILLNGLRCPKCPVVIHRACLKKYIKNCKTCVSCKSHWKNEDVLPVRTRDGSGEPLASNTSSNEASGHTGDSSQGNRSTDGDDVDMPVLEPVVPPRTTRAAQQSSPKQDRKPKKNPVRALPTRSSKRGRKLSSSSESE